MPDFHKSIDTVSGIIDSLKTLYTDKNTKNELDSINKLLQLKEGNLSELLEFRRKNGNENYYDRVLKRLEKADYLFETDDYKRLKKLKPYQRKVIIDYLEYAKKDNANRLTNRTADSLINTMKEVLLSLEMKEHNYQKNLAQKENILLDNDRKLSSQLRKIRAKIEQEEIQKSVARVKSTQDALNQTSKIMIVFGISCVITILIFVILIVRDTKKNQRYRKELERAKSYAESLLKSREQIMAAVTHDLRLPINTILGYSDLMGKTDLSPKQKTYLNQLKKSSDYTIRLVNDLLDFSKLEAGKILIEKLPFVPKDVVEDSVYGSIASPDPKNLKISLSLSEDLQNTFVSDPFRLRQILVNLIGNAYKFTEKGTLNISGEILQKSKKKYLRIAVKDSGIGISKKQQKLIFQEFSQAEASTEKRYGGSGLGLAINKKLASLLKGKISVKSKLGQGSTFILEIPVGKPRSISSKQEIQEKWKLKNANKYSILIVDDEETQRSLTTEILKNQGFQIKTAENGEEALAQIAQSDFDVVLTDIQMPKLNGFQLIKKIRQQKTEKPIPVVALSGEAGTSRESYLKKGFTNYLLKPFEPNTLLKILADLLGLEIETEGESKVELKINSTTLNSQMARENTLYDLTDLKTFTEGDRESVKLILKSLLENTQHNLEILNAARRHDDWKRVAFTAHKMLPMLRQIKAENTIVPLEKLERQKSENLNNGELNIYVDKALLNVQDLLKSLRKEVD